MKVMLDVGQTKVKPRDPQFTAEAALAPTNDTSLVYATYALRSCLDKDPRTIRPAVRYVLAHFELGKMGGMSVQTVLRKHAPTGSVFLAVFHALRIWLNDQRPFLREVDRAKSRDIRQNLIENFIEKRFDVEIDPLLSEFLLDDLNLENHI